MTYRKLLMVMLVAATLASCAERKVPAGPLPAPPSAPAPAAAPAIPPVAPVSRIYRETGTASWYGREFHGRTTASGEIFDMYGMSAAHRTLPLGTVIRVTNLDNNKSVTVTINDRGPFVKKRIIELSYGAAKELGFIAQGTAPVKIETLKPVDSSALYTVQAAVFTEEESAKALKYRLTKKFGHVFIVPYVTSLGKFYRVRVGSYGTEEKAKLVASRLKLEGLEPFIIRKE
jgi:rare lipoprotein A